MRRARRLLAFAVACGLMGIALRPAGARTEDGMEYQAKLAFIYNMAKFVEWPAGSFQDPDSPLTIGIVGIDPFSPVLEAELRTRKVGGHPVEIRTLKVGDAMGACQIVFFPFSERDEALGIVKRLERSNTLTVGETEGFATIGGIVNLIVERNRMHFEVNPHAAERAGLKISSRLLTLATIVKER